MSVSAGKRGHSAGPSNKPVRSVKLESCGCLPGTGHSRPLPPDDVWTVQGRVTDLSLLENMRTFVRVVEMGNLSAAGRSLRMSPAVVSHRIQQLEQRLGV